MGRLLLYAAGIGLVVGPRSRVALAGAGACAGASAGALGRGLFRLWSSQAGREREREGERLRE
jgi:hypothetical protein